MFMVDQESVVAIQTAYAERGMDAAIAALRQRFMMPTDAAAASCVNSIIRWVVVQDNPPAVPVPPKAKRAVTRRRAAAP